MGLSFKTIKLHVKARIHSLIFFSQISSIKFRQIRLYCNKVYIKNDKFISMHVFDVPGLFIYFE